MIVPRTPLEWLLAIGGFFVGFGLGTLVLGWLFP